MPPDEAQAPMMIAHFGSGNWVVDSFDCEGHFVGNGACHDHDIGLPRENRVTSAPNRAISNRAHAVAIISIAQNARSLAIAAKVAAMVG